MISGLWSNSNWDDDKNTRQKALSEIEESYRESIRQIYNTHQEMKSNKKTNIDFEDPFFAPISHLEP